MSHAANENDLRAAAARPGEVSIQGRPPGTRVREPVTRLRYEPVTERRIQCPWLDLAARILRRLHCLGDDSRQAVRGCAKRLLFRNTRQNSCRARENAGRVRRRLESTSRTAC